MVNKKTLASVVRRARTSKLWTQADLAAASKLSPSLIANIECGKTVRVLQLTASKLERALGVRLTKFAK
jgi:ribosome-binding protein aMBF1 (putative translation factor)